MSGKSVQDFGSPGNVAAIRSALDLLPTRQKKFLLVAAFVQILLNLLDLLGILLIGLVAAVAAWQVSNSGQLPQQLGGIIDRLGLADVSVSRIAVALAVIAVFALVAKTALQALLTRYVYRFLAQQQADVSARLATEFLRRPLMFIHQWTTSEATYALGGGVSAATVALLGASITIVAETTLFGFVLVTLLLIDPWVTVAAVVLFGSVIMLTYRFLSWRTAKNAQILRDNSIATLSTVAEAIQTYREVIVLNRRDYYASRYSQLVHGVAHSTASNTFIMEVPKFALEATLYLGVLALGGVQALVSQSIVGAAGTTAVFLAAGTRVVPALLRLQGAVITVRNSAVSAQPTFFLVEALSQQDPSSSHTPIVKRRTADPTEVFSPHVKLSEVTYTYPGASEPALISVNLEAEPGTSVALVGSTGAGKSTLADIILGVLQPDTGTALVSGVPPALALES